MRGLTLHSRSLAYYWRAHLALLLGVGVGTAVLSGALLVGDSLHGSLRAAALERLDDTDCVIRSTRFFRTALGHDLAVAVKFSPDRGRIQPAIILRGTVTHGDTHATARGVNILGMEPGSDHAGVALNQTLADDLGARMGDDILLRLGKPAAVSPDTLLGRRDDTTLTIRLTVERIIPARGRGAFALQPAGPPPRNVYVPLAALQRALKQPERVNTLLLNTAGVIDTAGLEALLRIKIALADLGLRLRTSDEHRYVALESDAFLLPPPAEEAGRAAAAALGCPPRRATAILSYLANEIALAEQPDRFIPYSVVAAVDPASDLAPDLPLAGGEILLSDWAASDLNATVGEHISLAYYLPGPLGGLDTRSAAFRLSGVVPVTAGTVDDGFTPEYPGVTDAQSMTDWDPPFPIDLGKIRPQDEQYWQRWRTTPKAFVNLADGQRLWADGHEHLGRLTSLRVQVPAGQSLPELRAAFEKELLRRLDPAQFGLQVDDTRARALAASRPTTDFAWLFLGFSLFLVISAALLIALLFRLHVERRSREIGLLLAIGFTARRVRQLLLAQSTLAALAGAGLGLLVAHLYTWLVLAAVGRWWAETIALPPLRVHAAPRSYVMGLIAGVVVARLSIAGSLRGIMGAPARALLAGWAAAGSQLAASRSAGYSLRWTALTLAIAAALLTGMTPWLNSGRQAAVFFIAGSTLLAAGVLAFADWLRREPPGVTRATGYAVLLRFGIRSARRHVGRSLLVVGLIAAATFIITALAAMRLETDPTARDRLSGTGGFTLLAESDLPLPQDLNTAAGRAGLGILAPESTFAGVSFVPLRLRDGDEISCRNLYRPAQPRLLGAPHALIERGGFTFADTLAGSEEERQNPWLLLRRGLPQGVVPAIADQAAALWQLHRRLGQEVVITDERGRQVPLRLMALLAGSVLQGEVIISESNFVRLFPSSGGYRFFLIDAPVDSARHLKQALEQELAGFGLAVIPTDRRLAELLSVQNVYLATFQLLSGLGLLLGTVGLAVVLLRNVEQRRSELALLQALGFSKRAIGLMLLVENTLLVLAGLLCGLVSAAVIITPQVAARGVPVPWLWLSLTLVGILVAGLLAGVLALRAALRAPLLPALRSE